MTSWVGVGLLAGLALGCATSPADRTAAQQAWEARDQQRAQECLRAGGRWNGSSCAFKCG